MVHLRLNENESNPNPHVNFITALPMADPRDQERARQLLRALAAQVKPIMKDHGFAVNSLEEYEHNDVFAGRNWNNGETVELVLRRRDGSFTSTSWLMGTLCHELAHIKVDIFCSLRISSLGLRRHTQHMDHGPGFQALWNLLRKEVVALQARGYYGDGMWSSGTRLADSAVIAGQEALDDDLPEYMCGGAQSRARPSARRRRRQPVTGPSMLTGAQTAKRRKAGSRITAAETFLGPGQALNADEDEKTAGTGFRKKALSKRAREERAMAAEKRQLALEASANPTSGQEEDDSDADTQELRETDQERRQTMMDSMDASEAKQLRTGTLSDIWGDFILPKRPLDKVRAAKSKATGDDGPRVNSQGARNVPVHAPSPPTPPRGTAGPELSRFCSGKLPQEQTRGGKRMSGQIASHQERTFGATLPNPKTRCEIARNPKWSCLVCTLDNDPEHLACSACATPRGDTTGSNPPSDQI
ncbi:WLM-domain-containing protein [Lactarius deliciosus]|nr:WLM-domain-containing protein [Lactarius deliciosus]